MKHNPVVSGQKYGRLTTVEDAGRAADGHRLWRCLCECGTSVIRQSNNLRIHLTPHCGCASRELSVVHGYRGTPTYSSWVSAIGRCHNKDSKDFHRYGAVGVTVCPEWRASFEAFLAHMGERPIGTTLDRIKNSGNYEPGNCRWATPTEQARNRRRSIYLPWKGQIRHLAEIATEMGITYGAAFMRHKRGKLV